jgi:ACS family hexuronate transporter-like MFS transporter
LGSWLAGGAVVLLHVRGVRLHRSRMLVFAAGVGLVGLSALLPWHAELGGRLTAAVVLLTGFGALGLFAAYFALSQEVSGRHQGKVTGVLGAANSLWLAATYEAQGRAADYLGGYDRVLGWAWVPAVLALTVVAVWWPRDGEQTA